MLAELAPSHWISWNNDLDAPDSKERPSLIVCQRLMLTIYYYSQSTVRIGRYTITHRHRPRSYSCSAGSACYTNIMKALSRPRGHWTTLNIFWYSKALTKFPDSPRPPWGPRPVAFATLATWIIRHWTDRQTLFAISISRISILRCWCAIKT